jgi:hypothetical protein
VRERKERMGPAEAGRFNPEIWRDSILSANNREYCNSTTQKIQNRFLYQFKSLGKTIKERCYHKCPYNEEESCPPERDDLILL